MRAKLTVAAALVCTACATPRVGFVPRGTSVFSRSLAAVEVGSADGLVAIGWVYASEVDGALDASKARALAEASAAGGELVVFSNVSGERAETSSFSGSSSLGMLSGTTPLTMYAGTVSSTTTVAVTRVLGLVYRRDQVGQEPRRRRPFLDRLAQAQVACPRGEPEGCGDMGSLTRPRGPPASEPEAALAFAERECAEGNPFACENAGWQYSSGLFAAPKDPARSAQYRRRGCALGAAASCSALASEGGPDRAALLARAKALRAQWCAAGELMSCPENFSYEQRLARQTALCHAGRVEHCFFAALPVPAPEGVTWMKQLCADGDPRACEAAAPAVPRAEGLMLAAEACALGWCDRLEALLSGD